MSESAVKLQLVDQHAETLKLKDIVRYREKRIDTSTVNNAFATFDFHGRHEKARILNISRFGVRLSTVEGDTYIGRGEIFEHLEIKFGDVRAYLGSATVVNEFKCAEGEIQLGLTLYGEGIDLDQVSSVLHIDSKFDSVGSVKTVIELSKAINPEFKTLVADLSTILADLRMKLEEEEKRIEASSVSKQQQQRLEEHTITIALKMYEHDIHTLFEGFERIVKEMDSDTLLLHKRYFRVNFHHHLLATPFVNRSFNKPLGYAGDYGLMVMLYQYEDIGRTLFEKFFHRWCCNAPSAVANKNRVVYLADLIQNEYVKHSKSTDTQFLVSSVACGPAREIQLFVEVLDKPSVKAPIKTVCLDQEAYALEYAQNQLRKLCSPELPITNTFLKEDAVLGIIKNKHFTTELKGSNVISCAGLFDYLSDRLSSRLISSLYNLLAPGGVLLIGNVSDMNPDRFTMDFLMEWNLLLRSQDDLLNLVSSEIKEVPGVEVDVISEALGLNLFLRIRKPNV